MRHFFQTMCTHAVWVANLQNLIDSMTQNNVWILINCEEVYLVENIAFISKVNGKVVDKIEYWCEPLVIRMV